ncbi:hypothetical protein DY000_02031731 [Brassica cretica]|uniref:Uncharacterized protein n=1 Tax=Brassica cretica TaxID=69181 RepID=A0ABQ7DRI1_BRACR|nr:hypothetical protein DY000_02031731 [Brassica cretica]
MAPLPLYCVYAAPPLVGPASSVGEDDLVEWRSRGTIPAVIAGLCNLFEISPSQLNPHAWRILIAIQNLRDLEYLTLGINEVLFAYHLAPLKGGEGRFHLRPRSGLPIVVELPNNDRKGPVFNKKWQGTRTHPAPSEGEKAILRARQLPADRRQVNFLVSETVLRRSSLWRDMSGGATNDPFEAYQEAVEVMYAKKGSSSRSTSGDEVMITGSRRSPLVKLEPSPSFRERDPKVVA